MFLFIINAWSVGDCCHKKNVLYVFIFEVSVRTDCILLLSNVYGLALRLGQGSKDRWLLKPKTAASKRKSKIKWATSWQNLQKWPCAWWSLRSAWASALSDESLRCALNGQQKTQAFFIRTAKNLIRLGGCPGLSEVSLGAHVSLFVLSWGGSNRKAEWLGWAMVLGSFQCRGYFCI